MEIGTRLAVYPSHSSQQALAKKGASAPAASRAVASEQTLSPQEQALVRRLRQIDQKVRQHEQAHLAAAQGIAVSGASFQYARGPDGKQYAVAGEVRIDTSPGRDPESTIEKARRIRAAALAPADPSPQDRAVAASAMQMEAQARAELNKQRQEQQRTGGEVGLAAYAAPKPQAGQILDVFA